MALRNSVQVLTVYEDIECDRGAGKTRPPTLMSKGLDKLFCLAYLIPLPMLITPGPSSVSNYPVWTVDSQAWKEVKKYADPVR